MIQCRIKLELVKQNRNWACYICSIYSKMPFLKGIRLHWTATLLMAVGLILIILSQLHVPCIMEAWFPESEKIMQPGNCWPNVYRAVSFATKQDVKRRPASLLCHFAKESSSMPWKTLVPEIFLVPPAPTPLFSMILLKINKI